MKFSKQTLAVLKNFATINSHLLIKQGQKLETISAQKNVMASVSVTETFPSEFGIYDLNEFLGAMSLFEDPDLEFGDKSVTISHGGNSIKYYAAAAENLTAPPSKEVQLPSEDVTFRLNTDTFAMIQKTASVLHSGDVSVIGDGSQLKIVVSDKKNSTSNAFESVIGTTDKSFQANLKVDNLKMIPGEYDVTISAKRISKFKAPNSDLQYFVAVEADSTFA